jgi:hypothetical protein
MDAAFEAIWTHPNLLYLAIPGGRHWSQELPSTVLLHSFRCFHTFKGRQVVTNGQAGNNMGKVIGIAGPVVGSRAGEYATV